jgi:hypothetical protein
VIAAFLSDPAGTDIAGNGELIAAAEVSVDYGCLRWSPLYDGGCRQQRSACPDRGIPKRRQAAILPAHRGK